MFRVIGAVFKLVFLIGGGLTFAAWKLLFAVAALLAWMTSKVVQHGIRGQYRAMFLPAWILAATVASIWVPWAEAGWALTGLAIQLGPDTIRGRSWFSARERLLVGRECGAVSLALVAHLAGLAWPLTGCLLAAVAAGFGVPWWKGRRPRPYVEPLILTRWRDDVASVFPALAGTFTEFDEEAGLGVLELTAEKASVAAKMDEDAEWALHQPRGTVTISADPRLSVRCVRVAFTAPEDGGRMRFWEGPTLQKDFQFSVMYAKGGIHLGGRLRRPDGIVHIAVVAPQGAGKGSIQRLIALEASLSPEILLIGVDGKRGKGIGYMQAGFSYLARDPDDWEPTVAGVLAELERRESEPGDDDSFVFRPGRPQIMLMIDENPKVVSHAPRVGGMLDQITARGRSLGVGVCLSMQKGDGPSYGSTRTRANIYGQNGWLWAGPAIDAQAKITMLQGFEFDPSTLPQEAGWAAVMGRALGDQPVIPGRTLWIPNRLDVHKAMDAGASEAEACPFGTVEDWLERDAIQPELCPEALDALDMNESAAPRATNVAQIGSAPSAPAMRPEAAGWVRIKEVLRDAARPMQRSEIARLAGLTPRTVSEHLSTHEGSEVVNDPDKQTWELAS